MMVAASPSSPPIIRSITSRRALGAKSMVSKTARPEIPGEEDEVDDLTIILFILRR